MGGPSPSPNGDPLHRCTGIFMALQRLTVQRLTRPNHKTINANILAEEKNLNMMNLNTLIIDLEYWLIFALLDLDLKHIMRTSFLEFFINKESISPPLPCLMPKYR